MVSASTMAGSTTLVTRLRTIRRPCSALRATNRSNTKAPMPSANASFAVPGIWPAASEA
ncbi:hypothetical protein ACVWZR_002786 [Bradyrhizobium sp. i1.3.1]